MNILHIDSSILGQDSVSRRLSARAANLLLESNPGADIEYLDLAKTPVPHLTLSDVGSRADKDFSDPFLTQFLNADWVVVGAPMYNFSVASNLKAWLDRLAVAGRTFKYTDSGAVGLMTDKSVIIASSRGNIYQPGSAAQNFDYQERYLECFFEFLGVEDLRFVRAEGLALDPADAAASVASALSSVCQVIA